MRRTGSSRWPKTQPSISTTCWKRSARSSAPGHHASGGAGADLSGFLAMPAHRAAQPTKKQSKGGFGFLSGNFLDTIFQPRRLREIPMIKALKIAAGAISIFFVIHQAPIALAEGFEHENQPAPSGNVRLEGVGNFLKSLGVPLQSGANQQSNQPTAVAANFSGDVAVHFPKEGSRSWTGEYYCGNPKFRVGGKLTIYQYDGVSNSLKGRFDSYPVSGTPRGIGRGASEVIILPHQTSGKFVIRPVRWIRKPAGESAMVDMIVSFSNGNKQISGLIDHPLCDHIGLRLDVPKAIASGSSKKPKASPEKPISNSENGTRKKSTMIDGKFSGEWEYSILVAAILSESNNKWINNPRNNVCKNSQCGGPMVILFQCNIENQFEMGIIHNVFGTNDRISQIIIANKENFEQKIYITRDMMKSKFQAARYFEPDISVKIYDMIASSEIRSFLVIIDFSVNGNLSEFKTSGLSNLPKKIFDRCM